MMTLPEFLDAFAVAAWQPDRVDVFEGLTPYGLLPTTETRSSQASEGTETPHGTGGDSEDPDGSRES